MAEKKTTTKAAAKKEATVKAEPAKKAPAKKATATKAVKAAVIYVNAENAGFRAGDVYQTLAKEEKALTVAEIAKKAKIATEEVYLGIGWLMKEGKVASTEDNKLVLA